ncbi:uncharacterized protein GGS22DRAFT_151616 [Annulohypoxylon maeteangense]|uniref:uncharacterized protein n=1 Tax=Annulohypoxylon maeteangense TaxID=1927788 RepID=UPI0020089ED1|nr:uncharacterized protein GGS22DRAFT_151616 [Annulohypoxylon maeteangense]KAI0890695.1 hypothetical protein GGS22DRAFT_151616 [Annulohypoxylon maeteangense]
MAAPANKTIGDLNGKWILNKNLSDSVEPALALQGVGWLIRKTINNTTVTLHVKQYQGPPTPPAVAADDTPTVTRVDIDQIATAGVKGTTENRCLDFVFREHSDWLFGRVQGRSRWISAAELKTLVSAGGEAIEKKWVQDDFVTKDWLEGDAEKGGPEGETHMLNHVESLDNGWTALQVWGFQDVGGERRYARNIVVAKGDTYVAFRMIYDWVADSE